jgi:hypothetical protein
MRRRNEPAPDEGGMTVALSTILKELRFLKRKWRRTKRNLTKDYPRSRRTFVRPLIKIRISFARTASKETSERMNAEAGEAQPKARKPETGENGNYPGGNVNDEFHFQKAAETIQERVEVGGSRQLFGTLRPEASNMFEGIFPLN